MLPEDENDYILFWWASEKIKEILFIVYRVHTTIH